MRDDFGREPVPLPSVDGVTHRFVDVRGLQLHVAEAGQGEPLVMLHGWPQHWYQWRYLMRGLTPHYHVICPDLRGFGWSDAPARGYEKQTLADDVLGLLDVLGLEHVRLIGHDWGGWIGFLLCFQQPERFHRYLSLNILHPWQRLDLTLLANLWRFTYQWFIASPMLGKWLIQNHPELIGWLMRRDSAHPDQWSREDLAAYTDVLRDPARARAGVLLYRSFLLREALSMLRGRYRSTRLHVRTHVLFGMRDISVSYRLLRGYQAHADDMTVELVPDCGHFIAEECPDLVVSRAREFFR